MKRQTIRGMSIVGLLLMGVLLAPTFANAQALSDYTAVPPFVNNSVAPNILLLLDNSGSMNEMAYRTTFDPSTTYSGLFVSNRCYSYLSSRFQPDSSSTVTPPATCTNASYPWSGNLLNYVANRKIDMAKVVMIGGTCTSGNRDANGNCSQSMAQSNFSACCQDQMPQITVAQASGRMPASLIPASGNVYFHLRGSVSSLKGKICVKSSSSLPSSDTNCGSSNLFQITVDHPELTNGVIQQVGTKARFALMEFNTSNQGGKLLANMGSSISTLTTAIETTTPATSTPLAESLYEAVRYYAQISPAFSGSDYTTGVPANDPYYFSPPWIGTAQYVTCCQSFVIIFTDGQPTMDEGVIGGLQDYAHTAASHGTSDHCAVAAGCTRALSPSGAPPKHTNTSTAFHNSLTDHHDNCSAYYGGTTSDPCGSNGSHHLDDVAYYAHTTDLRNGTLPVLGAGNNLTGLQNLSVYTFFAFGTGANLLKDAAKVGGFTDKNGNNIPDLPEEYDTVSNLTGALGADGVPDNYFEAADAFQLEDRLLATITSILQRSASGTAVSVLATSSTGEGSLYQSYFYPSKFDNGNEIRWTGYTQGLFLDSFGNLREDSNADGKLVYQNDKIIKTRYDNDINSPTYGHVLVDRYTDSDGDGKADSSSPTTSGLELKDIQPIWEAGTQLALMDPTVRRLMTWVDSNNDGLVNTGEQIDFATSNSSTLAPYLRAGASPYTSTNIINFIRGTQVSGLRNRQMTVSGSLHVWKLGDPINSTPTVVAAPKERYDVIYGDASYTAFFLQYRNRRQVAYVGANDGMLHAFNAGYYHRGDDPSTTSVVEHGWFTRTATDNSAGKYLGDELWGFIPMQLLPHLQWLTRPDYTHVYYVDLKPKVTDVRIFCDAGGGAPSVCVNGQTTSHPNGWGTILIGGFRMGGSCATCTAGTGAPPMTVTADFDNNPGTPNTSRTFYSAYFVLDITDPEVDPKLLWVFSDSSLGLTTSYPAVVRVNPFADTKTDYINAKWFVLLGSGPTGYDGSIVQTAKLYAVNLTTGPGATNSLVTTMSVGTFNSWMGDFAAIDKDLDYRFDAAYVGRVINDGTLPWRGKMYRLTTTSCSSAPCTTGTWGIASGTNREPTEVLDNFACSPKSCNGPNEAGPITAAPAVTLDNSNKVWLFFGTGRFYGTADKTNTETQYFFGVKDSVLGGSCTQTTTTNCWVNDLVNVSSATICSVCTGNQVTGVTGVTTLEGTSTTSLQGLVASKDGWYTTLPTTGERALVTPTLLGGIVFFTTFIPTNDICSSAGDGYLYALFYLTGSANKESVIGTTTSGGNTNVNKSIQLGTGTGLASQMAVQIGNQGSGSAGTGGTGGGCQGGVTGYVQSSTGTLSSYCTKVGGVSSRYISWNNQRL